MPVLGAISSKDRPPQLESESEDLDDDTPKKKSKAYERPPIKFSSFSRMWLNAVDVHNQASKHASSSQFAVRFSGASQSSFCALSLFCLLHFDSGFATIRSSIGIILAMAIGFGIHPVGLRRYEESLC